MFDWYLKRDDVKSFVQQIKRNDRYCHKTMDSIHHHSFYVSDELALYIFYDALLKYHIIVNDVYLFDEYLEQLEKLYKKLDSFEDVRMGIHKLLVRMVSIKLNIRSLNDEDDKKKIITYIYNEYIIHGYYIHGYNASYYDSIKEYGLVPECYENYYERFLEVNRIFNKYKAPPVVSKNFISNKIYFTDDFVRGCYYSACSPMFFYEFLTNDLFANKKSKKSYVEDDYYSAVSGLKKYMSNNLFNEFDRKYILKLVEEEWELLHRSKKKICLLLVKRRKIFYDEHIRLADFLEDESDLFEVVDRLLSSKRNNVSYNEPISADDIEFISFDLFGDKDEIVINNEEDDYYQYKENEVGLEFSNVYGNASILILLGSIFISMGVIISILMALRG